MAGKRTPSMLLPPRAYQTRSQNAIRVCHIFCQPPPPSVYQRVKQAAVSLYNYLFSPSLSLPSPQPLTIPDSPPPASTYSKPLPQPSFPVRKAIDRRESAVQTSDLDFPREKRRRTKEETPLPAKKMKTQLKPAKPRQKIVYQLSESLFNPQEMERLKTGSCSAERFLARLERVGRARSASPHESDLSCPTTPEPELQVLADPISPEPAISLVAPITPPHSLAIQPVVVVPPPARKETKPDNQIFTPPIFDVQSSAATSVPPASPALPSGPTSPMKLFSDFRSPSPPPKLIPALPLEPAQPVAPAFPTLLSQNNPIPTPIATQPEEKKEEPKSENVGNEAASLTALSSNPFLSPIPTTATSYKFVFGQQSPEKPISTFQPQVSSFSLPQDTEMATEQHGAPSPFFPPPTPFGQTAAITPIPDFGATSQISPLGTFGGPAVFGPPGNGQSGGFSLGVVKKRQR